MMEAKALSQDVFFSFETMALKFHQTLSRMSIGESWQDECIAFAVAKAPDTNP